MKLIERGISQRDLDDTWRAMGGEIEEVHKTGERRYRYPKLGKRSGKYSVRRKDASIHLVSFVNSVIRLELWGKA